MKDSTKNRIERYFVAVVLVAGAVFILYAGSAAVGELWRMFVDALPE